MFSWFLRTQHIVRTLPFRSAGINLPDTFIPQVPNHSYQGTIRFTSMDHRPRHRECESLNPTSPCSGELFREHELDNLGRPIYVLTSSSMTAGPFRLQALPKLMAAQRHYEKVLAESHSITWCEPYFKEVPTVKAQTAEFRSNLTDLSASSQRTPTPSQVLTPGGPAWDSTTKL